MVGCSEVRAQATYERITGSVQEEEQEAEAPAAAAVWGAVAPGGWRAEAAAAAAGAAGAWPLPSRSSPSAPPLKRESTAGATAVVVAGGRGGRGTRRSAAGQGQQRGAWHHQASLPQPDPALQGCSAHPSRHARDASPPYRPAAKACRRRPFTPVAHAPSRPPPGPRRHVRSPARAGPGPPGSPANTPATAAPIPTPSPIPRTHARAARTAPWPATTLSHSGLRGSASSSTRSKRDSSGPSRPVTSACMCGYRGGGLRHRRTVAVKPPWLWVLYGGRSRTGCRPD